MGFYRDHRVLILGLCRDTGKENGKYHTGVIWGILSMVDVEVLVNCNWVVLYRSPEDQNRIPDTVKLWILINFPKVRPRFFLVL